MTKGFTLIEVLIYAAIFVIVVGGMMMIAFAMLTSTQRAITQVEIADNSRFVVQKMQRVIQGATNINTPLGGPASSLSIDTPSPLNNPTIIDLSGGVLRIKRGFASPIPITNSLVTVEDLEFYHYVLSPGTKGTIRMKAEVVSIDPNRPASTSIDIFISAQ